MQKLKNSMGPEVTMGALRFTRIRTYARPQTRNVSNEVKGWHERLLVVRLTYQNAEDERVAATAEQVYRFKELYIGARKAATVVLIHCANNKADPRYLMAIPRSPLEAMRRMGPATTRYVNHLIHCLRTEPGLAEVQHLAAPLETLHVAYNDAARVREEKWAIGEQARHELDRAMREVKDAYNTLFHRFVVMLPGQKGLIESFFRKVTLAAPRAEEVLPVD